MLDGRSVIISLIVTNPEHFIIEVLFHNNFLSSWLPSVFCKLQASYFEVEKKIDKCNVMFLDLIFRHKPLTCLTPQSLHLMQMILNLQRPQEICEPGSQKFWIVDLHHLTLEIVGTNN